MSSATATLVVPDNTVYNGHLEALAKAQANLVTADLRLMLVTSTYVADKDHRFVSAVVANEISVAGYARTVLVNKVVVRDDAGDFAYLDADDVVWPTLAPGQTIGGAVLMLNLGSDATSLLMGHFAFAPSPTRDNTAVVFAPPAQGGVMKFYQPAGV